jgi:acyl-CoA thioesterase
MPGTLSGSMVSSFEKETRVRPVDGDYEAVLDPSWRAWKGPNGGYLAATLVRALRRSFPDAPRLRSLDVTFLEPASPGTARIATSCVRAGSSVNATQALMHQSDTERVRAQATFGAGGSGPDLVADDPPDVPPFAEGLEPPADGPVEPPTFTQHVDYRLVGGVGPLAGESGAKMRVWMRLTEPAPYDEALLAFLADAWMPATMAAIDEPLAVPSLDLHLQVHALPNLSPEEPLLGVFRAEHAREGYAFEDGTLWTPSGELVARARQTRRVLD